MVKDWDDMFLDYSKLTVIDSINAGDIYFKKVGIDIMERNEKFNPLGKSFCFRLGAFSCYMKSTGKCSLEGITLEEIKNAWDNVGKNTESNLEYCRGMAKLYLDGQFKSPATMYYHKKCDHYSFDDGQHRTCVVSHLNSMGENLRLKVDLTEVEYECYYCGMQEKYQKQLLELPFFDKVLKTKKYKQVYEDIKTLDDYCSIYNL